MNKTSIEWTHRPETGGARGGFTWNPIRSRLADVAPAPRRSGTFCTRISPGCAHCYASVINKRFGTGLEYTVPNLHEQEFFIDDAILAEPVRRKKPATIFAGDMFDLFHEAIPSEMIAEVLRVAIKTPWHTKIFLTKRAARMQSIVNYAQQLWDVAFGKHMWFGVSVEDQEYAQARIPLLFETRAAVRFVSAEPMLGPIYLDLAPKRFNERELDWVICGGESGPGARPFDLAWAESLLEQCRRADVPFFMKQTGANLFCQDCSNQNTHFCGSYKPKNRKGGDMSEWPEGLRVREFPEVPA